MKGLITNSFYTLSPFKVHWMGRWENGEKMHYQFDPPFKPYFYAHDPISNAVKKIEVDIPPDVAKVRENYAITYESDIVYADRVLIDLGIRKVVDIKDRYNERIIGNYRPLEYTDIGLKKIYVDIETDDRGNLNIENPTGEVLSIAIRDAQKNLTTIFTTIPQSQINTNKLYNLLKTENAKIKQYLVSKGFLLMAEIIGGMDMKIISKKNEKTLLETYHTYINSGKGADVQLGYNCNAFDFPYMQNRGKLYGLDMGFHFSSGQYGESWASHKKITNIDIYAAYMRLQENDLHSFSLESVSQYEFGIGKVKHQMGYHEMYKKDPELFLVYNYRDVLLCQLIDSKLGITDFFMMLSDKAGTLDAGKWNATYVVDSLMFRKTHGTEFKMPVANRANKKIEVAGGKVMEAKEGIYHNVIVCDFKHLYPNIIVQFNISPDTLLLGNQICPDDITVGYFEEMGNQETGEENKKMIKVGYTNANKKKGVIPSSIVELVEERYALKNKMKSLDPSLPSYADEYQKLNNEQRSVKELDNSFYGVTGSTGARLFNPYNQGSITYIARENLEYVVEYVEKLIKQKSTKDEFCKMINREMEKDFKILYGDTDSVFIWHPDWEAMDTKHVVAEGKALSELINGTFPEFVRRFNVKTDKIVLEMEFEKVYSVWEQWGKKKQYAGWISWKDGKFLDNPIFNTKGFDSRRSDRSLYGSTYFIPKLLQLVLANTADALVFYEQEVKKWIDHSIDPETIGIFISLQKEDYGNSQHGGSKYMPKRAYDNAIKAGIKLDRMKGKYRMYFLKSPVPNDVIAINYDDRIPKDILKRIDWNHHRERCMDVEVVKKIVNYLRNSENIFEVDDT